MPALVLAGVLLLVAASPAVAQCAPVLVPGGAVAGVAANGGFGAVRAAVLWDPDGAGPATPLLVLGGYFRVAGSIAAENIAAVEPNTGVCVPFADSLPGVVNALCVTPAGDLLAGGSFLGSGSPVVRWTGGQWVEVGPGQLTGWINDMVVLANGDVVVGGNCSLAPTNRSVARWDGQSWLPMGGGLQTIVNALVVLPNGNVVAGCEEPSVNYCAEWNGVWSPMANGPGNRVLDLTLLANGDVLALVLTDTLARWNGVTWTQVAVSGWQASNVRAITVLPTGEIVLAGLFAQGQASAQVLIGTGAPLAWTPLGGFVPTGATASAVTRVAALANGELIAGGYFRQVHGAAAVGVARWRTNAWEAVTSGTAGQVVGAVELPGGDVVAYGEFDQIGGATARRLARHDGNQWTPLGAGANGPIWGAFARCNGELWVSGAFTEVGGTYARGIAHWNGASWHAAPTKLVYSGAFAELDNGDLVAAVGTSMFSSLVSRWDGSAWQPLGQLNTIVRRLRTAPNGDLLGSRVGVSGPPVMRWDGTGWTGLGVLNTLSPEDLLVGRNGEIWLACSTPTVGALDCVVRWDGAAWMPLTGLTGSAFALQQLPNGDLLASGTLRIGVRDAYRTARWNGTTWSWFGPNDATAMLVTSRGQVWLTTIAPFLNGAVAGFHARLEPSCHATAASFGAGCTSSGGPVQLFMDSQPWLGSTFRAGGVGIPANAIVLGVRGLTAQSVPLASVVPQGQPGCMLLTSVDLLDVMLPAWGTVSVAMPIPNAMALVGQTMRYQLLPAQFDASGGLTAVTSSNALQLTFGTL